MVTWRRRPRSTNERTRLKRAQEAAQHMEACEQYERPASSCADSGVFRGRPNENEFLRRFREKYMPLGYDDWALLEILGDDHPGQDVGPERANLGLGPNQPVSEFCVILKGLAQKANPDCSISDRSLEYAQILLDNVREWPEHVQLLSLLHRSDPRKAYSEIKQLAITIEQSRGMYGTEYRDVSAGTEWKKRRDAYRSFEENDSVTSLDRRNELQHQETSSDQKEKDFETRKCFNCSKMGHIARNCPLGRPTVKNINERKTRADCISEIKAYPILCDGPSQWV
ncbi:zinc knuckle [Cooperia oncophora]